MFCYIVIFFYCKHSVQVHTLQSSGFPLGDELLTTYSRMQLKEACWCACAWTFCILFFTCMNNVKYRKTQLHVQVLFFLIYRKETVHKEKQNMAAII